MFHPIYNLNGRVSIFRLICLVIIAVCMLLYGILLLSESNEEANSNIDRDALVQKNNVQAQNKTGSLTDVIYELQNASSYLSSCGIINQGFEGCEINFSKNISDKFLISIDLAEDGYSLELKSKNKQHCALILVMNDEFRAYDEQGKFASDCLKALSKDKAKLVRHDYESLQGQPAPSGFAPIFTQTAENIKINHTL